MSDDNRDEDARKAKQPAQSGSIPGPVYDNPNEDQHADDDGRPLLERMAYPKDEG